MFKKTMKFEDLNGDDVEQTFYFNYNKKEAAELLEFGRILEFPPEPDFVYEPLEKVLKDLSTPVEVSGLSQADNNRMAYLRFQSLILDAFGKKADDNVRFEKTVELRNYFKHHVAFVEMIFDFLGDEKQAAEFIEKCLPPRLVEAAKKEMASRKTPAEIDALVEEAARRQADPATRIEPGPQAAAAALGENAPVANLASAVAADTGEVPEKKQEDMTPEDILALDDAAFKKIDVRRLTRESMLAAYQRKNAQ